MEFINIHQAKTNLSKYLDQVCEDHGRFIICKNGKPIVELIAYKSPPKRVLGLLKNQIEMSDDFNDDLPEEFMEYFE